ncbi:hypothetical protein BDN72DRAFT_846246 [Pluteus cervinus]|uniref:Uncharacterized protein n=1 Tax=Pluteus cervinus TaxID=181527 RepID=A0ACD3AGN2_9AGAR|nr:hypothetical protein BDN72DRAFT_846246 [Pluteus cervinus]
MDHFPFEIWQEIINISAYASFRQAAILARVSRLFNEWARPILYRVCKYYYDAYWPGPNVPSVAWFKDHGGYIRHLLWGLSFGRTDTERASLVTILELCPNLQEFALWVNPNDNDVSSLQPVLSKLSLRRLSINPLALFSVPRFLDIHAQHLMFRSVTHLDLLQDAKAWEEISGLAALPSLTHLALSDGITYSIISDVVRWCDRLKVIVVVVQASVDSSEDEDKDSAVLTSIETGCDDLRVVAFECAFVRDWELGATGGRDIWVKAEEVVEKRMKMGG